MPPPKRHPEIHDAFAELDSGEVLEIVNDRERRAAVPRPR